jgi:drug/metabolite transporter (DMT)-like permease
MNIFLAFICVALFAMTAPFTRIAALAISPESIILIRIIGAAVVCAIYLIKDGWIPPKKAWPGIIATALGSVIGFNSLMAFGLREVPSGHAAVALAGLPLGTSIYSVLRDRKNPGSRFWFFVLLGTLLSCGFFFFMNIQHLLLGDLLLLLAVLAASFGYVEGGRSSRLYGGARTMSWAVLITLPICIPYAISHFKGTTESYSDLSSSVWFSLAYVALVSQSLGMFLWFRVLAVGPMEKVAMVQLLQPFITLLGAIVILGEQVLPITWGVAGLVALCIVGSNRERKRSSI